MLLDELHQPCDAESAPNRSVLSAPALGRRRRAEKLLASSQGRLGAIRCWLNEPVLGDLVNHRLLSAPLLKVNNV